MNSGQLKGSGKVVILQADQGLEMGVANSFAKNPDAYDPCYHIELAIEAKCNAFMAPLGALETGARDYAGEIPFILKLSDFQTMNSEIENALRLGCSGLGLSLSLSCSSEPSDEWSHENRFSTSSRISGLKRVNRLNGQIMNLISEAKKAGLLILMDIQPDEPLDLMANAAHIAAHLGAHIVNVGIPKDDLALEKNQVIYKTQGIKISKLADRSRHLIQSCFSGKRILLFSGDEFKPPEVLLSEVSETVQGGAFGGVMGRNAFQRSKKEAIQLMQNVMEAYAGRNLI